MLQDEHEMGHEGSCCLVFTVLIMVLFALIIILMSVLAQ
jgi:hypothetical protein